MGTPRRNKERQFSLEDGFDANMLLREIGKIRSFKDGRAIFNSIQYRYLLPILTSAVRAPNGASLFKEKCIRRALADPKADLKDAESFIERCGFALESLLAQPKGTFRVCFDVTYSGKRIIRRLKDGHCAIHWQPSEKSPFMRKALSAREELIRLAGKNARLQPKQGMTVVFVTVNEAVDYEHAMRAARDSLDRLRGLINFLSNQNRGIRLFGGSPHAVNKMRMGPFQTVHNLDGTAAIKQVWYEPNWHHDQKSIEFKGTEKEIQEGIRGWWSKINRSPLCDHISDGLIRYCRSLDQHDSDAALIGLWGALESLTGTQMKNYDVTVNRVTRLFPDHAFTRQIAHHLRLRRNAHIHAAKSPNSDEVDMVLHHADRIVSGVLQFFIHHGRSFRNLQEAYSFMDLSLEPETLRGQRRLIDLSVQHRKGMASGK